MQNMFSYTNICTRIKPFTKYDNNKITTIQLQISRKLTTSHTQQQESKNKNTKFKLSLSVHDTPTQTSDSSNTNNITDINNNEIVRNQAHPNIPAASKEEVVNLSKFIEKHKGLYIKIYNPRVLVHVFAYT